MRDEIHKIPDYDRVDRNAVLFQTFEREIRDRFQSTMVSYPGDAQTIESIINLIQAREVLEIGMFTGFTTLHMLRAVWGRGRVTSVDRELHADGGMGDENSLFKKEFIQPHFRFVHGETPDILESFAGESFDLVYVDSDHSLSVTESERLAIWPATRTGTVFVYHDCMKRENQDSPELGKVYRHLMGLVQSGVFDGVILPSQDRLDVQRQMGEQYDRDFLPHLGIFIRK